APETWPNAYTAINTASPNAIEIAVTLDAASGNVSPTATTVPAPTNTSRKVPITSATTAPISDPPTRGNASAVVPLAASLMIPPGRRSLAGAALDRGRHCGATPDHYPGS